MQVTDEMVRVAADALGKLRGFEYAPYAALYGDLAAKSFQAENRELARECLTAALAAMWQPIETAPRDGQDIILYFPLIGLSDDWPKVVIGHKRAIDHARGHWVWQSRAFRGYSDEYQPTHWMPLPPAPCQLSKRDDAERDSIQEA